MSSTLPPGHDLQKVVERIKRAYGSVAAFAKATGSGSHWLAEGYKRFWP